MNRRERWVEVGQHSNIPDCCIHYWLWRRARPLWMLRALVWSRGWLLNRRPDAHCYVRCPRCVMLGRWNEQHICDRTCHGEPGHVCHRCGPVGTLVEMEVVR